MADRFKPQPFPHILNSVPYKDTAALYGSGSGISTGNSQKFSHRNGIAVTISVPPTLNAFRYPNLVAGQGTPYIAKTDKNVIARRLKKYRQFRSDISKTKTASSIERNIDKTKKLIASETAAGRDAVVKDLEAKLATLQDDLVSAKAGTFTKGLDRFSTEFEITDFLTSLSWSSSFENSFVEVNLGLDNFQGIFNHLPEAAKVTIWRRKSLTNINGLSSGKWYRYITCYIANKSRSASGREWTMDVTARDRLAFAGAQHYTKKKKFTKDKAHTKGWTARDITLEVCKSAGIPVNAAKIKNYYYISKTRTTTNEAGVKKTTTTNKKITLPPLMSYEPGETNLIAVLTGAWNRALDKVPEKDRIRYSLHMRHGELELEWVSPPGDPETQKPDGGPRLMAMFNDDDNIESASLEENVDPEDVFTQFDAKGTIKTTKTNKKGKKVTSSKKVKGTFYPHADNKILQSMILNAYGKRVNTDTPFKKNPFKTQKEFETAAQGYIDDIAKPIRKMTIEGRGPLGIWPSYYINVGSRFLGVRGNVWVENVNYSVEDGIIKISLELNAEFKHFTRGEKLYGKFPKVNDLNVNRWYY